ncbi:hypothetical protein OOK36_35595 [Streptomyces sp. NBC_00365]|uniref:hypothetical protein n=1 Tax=Streptomyces sp. NBC_00365 TaxID=2975726 RepID=UPI002255A2FA|nr:hypothetical protein [Streptomyces sp. NBC_00365]MCX5094097.1 hypothetical protein [Streptomyces sp. NBC_00365]
MSTEDDLPAGAHGVLVQALRDLYESAGRPPVRRVAELVQPKHHGGQGVSYETVRKMLGGMSVPKWEKWQMVVNHLCAVAHHDDPKAAERDFLEMWRKATSPVAGEDPAPRTHQPLDEVPDPPDGASESPSFSAFSSEMAARNARVEELVITLYARAQADAERIREAARQEAAAEVAGAPIRKRPVQRRQPAAVLGIHAMCGLLLGMVVGILVNSAVLPLTEERYYGAVGAMVGLVVGTFAGTVIASMGGAQVGKIFLIRDALAGLAGCGGLLGLTLGVCAGIQHGGVVNVALLTAAEGGLFGCLLGAIVYGVRFLHPGAASIEEDTVSPGPSSRGGDFGG